MDIHTHKALPLDWFRSAFLVLNLAAIASAQVNVLNVNYDQQQTGANLQETILSPKTDWTKFGKAGTFPVDGQVYAQPLYVSDVSIGGASVNVLYVATMHDSIFAFNADTPQSATPLWQVNLGAAVPTGLFNFTDLLPEIGILGTPAIDPVKQVLYVVSDTLPAGAFSNPLFQLHALSLVDGHEMFDGPVDIEASVSGTGAGSSNGTIAFNAFWQLQRPGMILANSTLYIAFGSHADAGNYQGWILAYNPSTLHQTAVFNSAPNGRQGAFWHSGRAPVIESNGDVIAVTGNGDFDGKANFGESIVRLSGSNLSLLDWYTPQEWSSLNEQDWDLGSTGAILIPNTNLLVTGGKSGMIYVAEDNSLGHLGPDVTSTVQGQQLNAWGLFTMALWNNAPGGPVLYEYEPNVELKAYQIANGQLNSTILSLYSSPDYSLYAGLSLSANGSENGLVWMITGNQAVDGDPATLHVLNATNLADELWNSNLNSARDQPGEFTKFAPPTVANGRVYMPTLSNAVVVYGVLTGSSIAPTPVISSVVNSASFLPGPVAPGELVTIFGANLGPSLPAGAQLSNNLVAHTVENTQVLIGGVAAPILYASATQINTIVPFGVSGATTEFQVTYQGQPMAALSLPVDAASPAIFSSNGSGGGEGAILNQDGSVNSGTNPAAPGSVVALFATGGGLTTPASDDGALTTAPYPAPDLPVSVTIAGTSAQVKYAGAAPGLVAGVLQIDVVVPADTPAVTFNQVVVTIGTYVSPSAVTVSVK
jgi:uncharacterized protein (TIGR03437 family)